MESKIRETVKNCRNSPKADCSHYCLDQVHFAYPMSPSRPVISGVSFKV